MQPATVKNDSIRSLEILASYNQFHRVKTSPGRGRQVLSRAHQLQAARWRLPQGGHRPLHRVQPGQGPGRGKVQDAGGGEVLQARKGKEMWVN